MILFSEEGLADTAPSGDRRQSQSQFETGLPGSILPIILSQKLTSKAARESDFGCVRLANSRPVECSDHRIQQIRYEQAFKLVPAIRGRDQVEAFVINWPQKLGEPFGLDVCRFG